MLVSKVVDVVRDMITISIKHKIYDLNSPVMEEKLKEKGFTTEEIRSVLERFRMDHGKFYSSADTEFSGKVIRSLNDTEKRYLTKEAQSLLLSMYRHDLISFRQLDELINNLVAIASKPLTVQDISPLIKDYMELEEGKEVVLSYLESYFESERRKNPIH